MCFQRWDSKPALTINDFDRKLSETDAYLQILIDQVKVCGARKYYVDFKHVPNF